MNPNLDGFIAEQELVNSFNNSAVLEGSKYRAEALTPDVYGKNSFDIVIKDVDCQHFFVQLLCGHICKTIFYWSHVFQSTVNTFIIVP